MCGDKHLLYEKKTNGATTYMQPCSHVDHSHMHRNTQRIGFYLLIHIFSTFRRVSFDFSFFFRIFSFRLPEQQMQVPIPED